MQELYHEGDFSSYLNERGGKKFTQNEILIPDDPPVETQEKDAGTHEKLAQTDEKPSETQKIKENLMDMGMDQLNLESNVEEDVQAHIADQLPPHQEEGVDEDGNQNPFSSHENEEEDEGASREDRQGDKKRKRDANYDEKHSEE